MLCIEWPVKGEPLLRDGLLPSLFPFLDLVIFMFMFVCVLPACIHVYHVCAHACGGHKRASDTLELEIRLLASHHMGAGV